MDGGGGLLVAVTIEVVLGSGLTAVCTIRLATIRHDMTPKMSSGAVDTDGGCMVTRERECVCMDMDVYVYFACAQLNKKVDCLTVQLGPCVWLFEVHWRSHHRHVYMPLAGSCE